MLRYVALTMSLCAMTTLSPTAGAEDAWDAFIKCPNKKHQAGLADSLRTCADTTCARFVVPSSKLDAFCRVIERVDSLAVELGLLCLRGLDGGDLEDMSRSLGIALDKKPSMVLRLARRTGLRQPELVGVILMLPENVIDHPKRERTAAQRRLAAVQRAKDPELAEVREEAVRALREFLERRGE